jgi:subtilase family serine protease
MLVYKKRLKMTKKTKTHDLVIECKDEQDKKEKLARLSNDPTYHASLINIQANISSLDIDLKELSTHLKAQQEAVASGELISLEKMLVGQVQALQSIFSYASCKALSCDYLNQLQIYSKLALKAQNQCRSTVATLANMKAPKSTTFIKNQATNQQVNFNSEKNRANELLSEDENAPMDTRRTTTSSSTNQEMETLDA